MAPNTTYRVYKQDTTYLIYWIIETWNTIVRSNPPTYNGMPTEPNLTGQTTVDGILPMVELIEKHVKNVPQSVLWLFKAAITARTQVLYKFQRLAFVNPNLKKSNASHEYFIEVMDKAFRILGGEGWEKNPDAPTVEDMSEESVRQLVFQNKFSALSMGDDGAVSDGNSDHDKSSTSKAPRQRAQKKKGKGGGKKKKAKREKKAQKQAAEVPMDKYRIIGDPVDYFISVYNIESLCIQQRGYLQNVWREVAYDGLNSAVACALSRVAIAKIKKAEAAMFVDFPNREAYKTIMETITGGELDNAPAFLDEVAGSVAQPSDLKVMDIREALMIHTYDALIDFITDFQKTRSGKPTKRKRASLRDWKPDFDLQAATREQRLQWRRAYTINWLYDLVNVQISPVILRNAQLNEGHVLEDIDWSPEGEWASFVRLFGLEEFAGFITSLAVQKQGSAFTHRIAPSHVFLLQVAVDSFTISRGWSLSLTKGHVLAPPAPSFPLRDLETFLDGKEGGGGSPGFLGWIMPLCDTFEDVRDRICPEGTYGRRSDIAKVVGDRFMLCLGRSHYSRGLDGMSPPRFWDTDPNGMWSYSPFLCGTGLLDGLAMAYNCGLFVMDCVIEPLILMHLHNALLKSGRLSSPIPLYVGLQDAFRNSYFRDGLVPTGTFMAALSWKIGLARREPRLNRRPEGREVKQWLDLKNNVICTERSLLERYDVAGWDPTRIPEEVVDLTSNLGVLLLSRTVKVKIDADTGEAKPEDTPLVRRAKESGYTDERLVALACQHSEESAVSGPSGSMRRHVDTTQGDLSPVAFLKLMRADLERHIIHGTAGVNYLRLQWHFMQVLDLVERELSATRNPGYVEVYEQDDLNKGGQKRHLLANAVLNGRDEECTDAFVRAMGLSEPKLADFCYWIGMDAEGREEDACEDVGKGNGDELDEMSCEMM